jgi:transcription antitermination factor NusA-like protein
VVNTPICNFCAKTGVLCKKCKTKLRKKKITHLDVEISEAFAKIELQYAKQLQDVTFERAHQLNGYVALLTRNGSVLLENPEILERIENELRRPIEIVERRGDTRTTFALFFAPLDIVEIDQIFVPPEGDIEIRITLRGNPDQLRFSVEQSEQIARLISKNPVRIEIQE